MTTTLAPARPQTGAGRTKLVELAAREMRRFVLNPVFLFAVAITAWSTWTGRSASVIEIDSVNPFPAIFLGGFGMMATFWLTRLMRASKPVVGVTPTTRPARTAALCAVAIVLFGCGGLTLFAFLQLHPVGDSVYGAFSPSALLGFAAACVVRTRTGEPGPAAGAAVVLVLMAPSLVPQVARWVRTFPAPGAGGRPRITCGGPSSPGAWWRSPSRSVAEACPGGCPVFRDPGYACSRQRRGRSVLRSVRQCQGECPGGGRNGRSRKAAAAERAD